MSADLYLGPHNQKGHRGSCHHGYKQETFKVDGVKSGEAEKDKIWALQWLSKDWSSYKLGDER